MKSAGEIMEILEVYDLAGTYRGAARLAGCDHHTVQRYVERRETAADPAVPGPRPSMIDGYRAKIEELVERSEGDIRADVVHERLVAMGFDGTDRTTRRAVADAKYRYAAGRRRVYRPWITEPGGWLQVVELVVSVEQDIWHTVRAGWTFNGDWMWFTWHGDEVLVFSGQPYVADYGSLPIASFSYRPEASVTTPDAFGEACRGFEADNQELLDDLWGGTGRRQALRCSARDEVGTTRR